MKIINYDKNKEDQIIEEVYQSLINENLVILPTDTVYGIMALATSKKAVNDLYYAKKRSFSKPTAVLVSSIEQAKKIVNNRNIDKIGSRFWPGPLTIVAEAKIDVTRWKKIGVRIPDNKFLLKVLQKIDTGILASSANISGDPAPSSFGEVSDEITNLVDLGVDAGATKLEEASTVIELDTDDVIILREGPISQKEIDNVLAINMSENTKKDASKVSNILFICTGNTCRSPMAQYLFNDLAQKSGLEVKADSAGVMAMNGQKAARNAIWLMKQMDISLDSHNARNADQEILDKADIILAMDAEHLSHLPSSVRDKSFLLSEYSSDFSENIFDPVGCDLDTYEKCANLIEKHLFNLVKKLQNR